MVVLENEQLKVEINLKGAELTSIIDKSTNVEYIWQANKDVWAYHAPNLFPIVGGLKDNTLQVNGLNYPMNRHGFARTSTFQAVESTSNKAVFSLNYNEETLSIYPYKFEFQVIYTLTERSLNITYKVINKDDKDVYFSVGAHPGFNAPLTENENYEDYYLEFEFEEDFATHMLSNSGLFSGETRKVMNGNKLPLTKNLFEHDALVFKNLKSKSIALKNKSGLTKVKVDYADFNHLGLWAKPGAPFVCIEPWLGYADKEGDLQDISQKEAIEIVEQSKAFEATYTITV